MSMNPSYDGSMYDWLAADPAVTASAAGGATQPIAQSVVPPPNVNLRAGGHVERTRRDTSSDVAGPPVRRTPPIVKIPGRGERLAVPLPPVEDAARAYMRYRGREYAPIEAPPFDEANARRIAEAYESMRHAPGDRDVARSYEAMTEETLDQLRALKNSGYSFEFLKPGEGDPYARAPSMGYADLQDHGRLKVFPTDQGFGSLTDTGEHPLLKKVGPVGDLPDATANDAFRIVHDMFGHHGVGNPFFRAPGEEKAWLNHKQLYSDDALPAMTTETRGQNSWVNYGPHAERNRGASGADTIYADQKAGLLPAWVYGRDGLDYKRGGSVDEPDRVRRDTSDDVAGPPTAGRRTAPPPRPAHLPRRNLEFVDNLDMLFGGSSRDAGRLVREHTERTGNEALVYGNEFSSSPLLRGERTSASIPGAFREHADNMERQNMPFFSVHSHPVISTDPLGPRGPNIEPARVSIDAMQQGLPGAIHPSRGDLRVLQAFAPKQHTMMIEGAGGKNSRVAMVPREMGLRDARDMGPVLRALDSRLDPLMYERTQREYNTSVGNHPADISGYSVLINKMLAERGGLPMYVDSRATSSGGIPLRDMMPDFEGYLSKRDMLPYAKARGGAVR